MLAEFMFAFMELNKINLDLSSSTTRLRLYEYLDDGEKREYVEGEEEIEEVGVE